MVCAEVSDEYRLSVSESTLVHGKSMAMIESFLECEEGKVGC